MPEDSPDADYADPTDSGVEMGADTPAGGAYEWLQRAMGLLAQGNAAAAATLLERVRREDPTSASVLEALARAHYDAGHYETARSAFTDLVDAAPDSDYAHFGLGLSLFRLGRVDDAEPHLALAAVMRPGRSDYEQRLREVRATRAARRNGGADAGERS